MAVTIQSNPKSGGNVGPRPANQKLIYTIDESGSTTPERFIVQVYEKSNTSASPYGTEIAKLFLTPNANEVVHFDLSDIVVGRVGAPTETDAGDIIHSVTTSYEPVGPNGMLKYTVAAGSYDAGIETLDDDRYDIYLHGGAIQTRQGLHPSFADFYPTGVTKPWFLTDLVTSATNLPSNQHMAEVYMADDDEAVVLAYSTLYLGVPSILGQVRVKLYDDTDTLVHTELSLLGFGTTISDNFYALPLGPANMAAFLGVNWDTDWAYYDIDGVSTGSKPAPQSKTFRVRKDCRPIKNKPVQLAWSNTLGGWDYLRFDGRNLKTITTESKTYRKTLGNFGATTFGFNAWDRGKTAYHVTGTETWELRNRSFSVQERDLLQYAFRSQNVMYRIGTGDWLPCTINTNSYVVQPASAQLFDVSLTIELAQEVRC